METGHPLGQFSGQLLRDTWRIFDYIPLDIMSWADAHANLPDPGKVECVSRCGSHGGATNRVKRRPSLVTMEGFFMTEMTQIHPDKVRAYLATDYRLGHTSHDIVLTIGQTSERLKRLFADNGVHCGAFITAYNPRGSIQPDEANDDEHAQLAAKLHELGLPPIESSDSEEGTGWPSEKSYFALGLALEPAKAMGSYFDQDAIVWAGPDAIPQLILLR